MKITISTLALVVFLLLGWHTISAQKTAETQPISANFEGSFLAISDADMIATAYANGVTNKVAGVEDSLVYVQLNGGRLSVSSKIHASNSVISWPAIIEWHPEHRYAYVAETRGKITAEADKMKDVFTDFPPGKNVSVFDYHDPAHPVLLQEYPLGKNVQNVSINAQGDLLAAGTAKKGGEIAVAILKGGLVNEVFYFSDEEIDYDDALDGGIRTVEFHPTKNVIAVNLNGKKVAFYKINYYDGKISLEQIGPSLAVEKKLSVGNWHPTGKFFIVANVNWGKGALGAIFNKKGHLINIAFDAAGNHRIVSKVKVGLSPEGFDVSPDGKYAVAVNMRRTYGPKQFWFVPGTKRSSLSLVAIDETTGALNVIGKEYGFEGVLPEDAIFDRNSNSLAVAVYHEKNEGHPKRGWIDFWEIKEDRLVKSKTQLYLTRGVHNLLLIP